LIQEETQILVQLGLTKSQARVYLTLLEIEKTSAAKISKHSKIARQEVYRVLGELQEKGIVERILTKPTTFKPTSLKEYANLLMENEKSKNYEIQDLLNDLLLTHKNQNSNNNHQKKEDQFLLISKEVYLEKLSKAILHTRENIEIVNSFKCLPKEFNTFIEKLQKALERHVKIRSITKEKNDIGPLKKNIPDASFSVRLHPGCNQKFIIIDKKEVFIDLTEHTGDTDKSILWSNASCFSELIQHYFEFIWKTASKLS
jgi:HTH-type transcriptional regulator, sugar sensing transcriptional regulator